MSSHLNFIEAAYNNYNTSFFHPNLLPENSSENNKTDEEVINELIQQNEVEFLSNLNLLPTSSLKNKAITMRAIRLIEEHLHEEAVDLFLDNFAFRTTDLLDSLFNEKCVGDIIKILIHQNEGEQTAISLLQIFNTPWREHSNIFDNGFFDVIKVLLIKNNSLKKDDNWSKINELLSLIPTLSNSNTTNMDIDADDQMEIGSGNEEKELPDSDATMSDSSRVEQDIRSPVIFNIVKKLITLDNHFSFETINKLINLIKDEQLRQNSFYEITNEIIKTIDKFALKLDHSLSHQITDSSENEDFLSQLLPEILLDVFDFLDEKTLANLYLTNRYSKEKVHECYNKKIRFTKSFFYLLTDYYKTKNDYSLLGSIYDLIKRRNFHKVHHLLMNQSAVKSIGNSKKLNLFNLQYKIASFFKNFGDFSDFKKFLDNQTDISAEERKFFTKTYNLIDLHIKLKRLEDEWSESKINYSIESGTIKSSQCNDLNISENLHYIYYLLMQHARCRNPLLIYFTIHFLLERKQVKKAKRLVKLLPRYKTKNLLQKIDHFIFPQGTPEISKISRQVTEIALFEIFLAEGKFDKACKIVKKIFNHEDEFLLSKHAYNDDGIRTGFVHKKGIYKLFCNQLLEFNLYKLPLQLMESHRVKSWYIEKKVFKSLLETKASVSEVEQVVDFFPNTPSKNGLICAKAIELIKEEKVQLAMSLIRKKIKLSFESEEDYKNTASLSSFIEQLMEKNLIDEAIDILHLMSIGNSEHIYMRGFEVVFEYLLKNDIEKLHTLVITLNKNITFKAIESMIKNKLNFLQHLQQTEIETKAEETATLIKLLPAKAEHAQQLINLLIEKNLINLAKRLEEYIQQEDEYIQHEDESCVIC